MWTTYTYDGIGRTLSVTTAGSDTQGTTTYVYRLTGSGGVTYVSSAHRRATRAGVAPIRAMQGELPQPRLTVSRPLFRVAIDA